MNKKITDLYFKLYNSFRHVEFEEKGHKYKNLITNQYYQFSATKIKEKCKEEFNTKYISHLCALKTNYTAYINVKHESYKIDGKVYTLEEVINGNFTYQKTPEEFQKEWKQYADKEKKRGNLIHNYLENAWNGTINKKRIDYLDEYIYYKKQVEKIVPLFLEFNIADESINTAGKPDGIFYPLQIRDTKTDKEIKKSNKWEKLLYPFEDWDACNYNEYAIQLNIYRKIIKEITGIEINKLFIDWFDKEGYYEEIQIPVVDRKMELLWEMLKRK